MISRGRPSYIEFKPGVKVKTAHGLPHIWLMIETALAAAPPVEADTVVVTEAWREPRHPDDAHSWCSAFDLRIRNIITSEGTLDAREAKAWVWVNRMRAELDDPRYQFDVHGVGGNAHIHMEFDPR
tara:strand:+ start:504 stop:881 length:378 start_codon:yes stop_codon:yes gene_type:complete